MMALLRHRRNGHLDNRLGQVEAFGGQARANEVAGAEHSSGAGDAEIPPKASAN